MTQRTLDDLFSQTLSKKRSRTTQKTTVDHDEFDDLFETSSSIKRRRTKTNQSTDVFDLPLPSSSTSGSLKKKRSVIIDDEENKAIDDLFNNETRKKLRRPVKNEESFDLLDMFHTRTAQPTTTFDDFKTPKTQNKVKMFFDDTDLLSLREQNDTKDYTQIKPVLITSGQWLSKIAETKSTCGTIKPSDVPNDERNLMHIQYATLIIDDEIVPKKSSSTKTVLDGKSFHKQLVLSDSVILRKENFQSCYNALLEAVNKPRRASSSSKLTNSKSLNDEEPIDFFDLPNRRKKH